MPEPRNTEPTWIPADKNPFHIRVFDCRPFTRTATALTADPELAKSFLLLRHSDGWQRRGQRLSDATTVPCTLSYPQGANLQEGPVFRARDMEEKWDIDLFDDRLYFSRSWTGDLVIIAEVRRRSGFLTISSATAPLSHPDRKPVVSRDVDFLVKTHLFHREVPHSLPAGLPSTERAIVTYSFSLFGRAAAFASYEDTTKVPV